MTLDVAYRCERGRLASLNVSGVINYAVSAMFLDNEAARTRRINAAIHQYESPGRYYHNRYHVDTCIRAWYKLIGEFSTPAKAHAAFIALVYHDIVYDTHSSLNEENSVVEALANFGDVSDEFTHDISRFIMATKFGAKPADDDEALVRDIDLIAFVWKGYCANLETGIRTEYHHVPMEVYTTERKRILRKIYARPFFSPTFCRGNTVQVARRNIAVCLSFNNATVGVAGTFDLLHEGHKHLITQAIGLSRPHGRLIIGFTSDEMASKKGHPVGTRTERESAFIDWFLDSPYSDHDINITTINDEVGDAMSGDIDILVVSEESVNGGFSIVNEMINKGIPPVAVYTIPCVRDDAGDRISSTNLRRRM